MKLSKYETLILILSLYVIVELYISFTVQYSQLAYVITLYVDTAICVFFLIDFFRRFTKADSKGKFLKWNWIDFISAIPFVGFLRMGRIFRILRILRLVRSGKHIYLIFHQSRSTSVFKIILIGNLILLIIGALSLFMLERDSHPLYETLGMSFWANIKVLVSAKTPSIEPGTMAGRFIFVLLNVGSLILLSAFISLLSDYFIQDDRILEEIAGLKEQNSTILKELQELKNKRESNSKSVSWKE